MNGTIRLVLTVALTVVFLASFPASGTSSGAPHVAVAPRPASLGNGVVNYNVPGDVDVDDVATSPDGTFVAGITSGAQVLVFSNSTSGTPAPIATFNVPGSIEASSIAISGPQLTGGPHFIVIGYGNDVAAYNLTLGAGNVDLNSVHPVWAITDFDTLFGLPPSAGKVFVHQVVVSNNGEYIAVMGSFSIESADEVLITYAQNFVTVFGSSYYGRPVNMAIDSGGDWLVAGMTINGADSVMVFETGATPGWQGNYTTFVSSGINGGLLLDVAISGSGDLCYGVTYGGVWIINTATRTENGTPLSSAEVPLTTNSQVSASYSGDQVLISGLGPAGSSPGGAYYFNYSAKNWTEVWSGSFSDPVANATLAATNPDYFAVSTGTNIYWYYYYPGIPSSSTVYYRNATTEGPIHEMALSNNHDTAVVGSGYINGEETGNGGEFTVASDGGIPSPNAPSVSLLIVPSSAGASSASLTVQWVETGTAPISANLLWINLSSVSPSGLLPAVPIFPDLGTFSYTINGLSFATTYCVWIEAQAYGGASSASSSVVCAKTAAVPQSVDPVASLEIGAVGTLSIGVVGFVALTLLTARRKKDRLEPTPMGSGSPPPVYPPPSGGA